MDPASNPNSSTLPAPAEPCPTPLSTPEVFESFERDCTHWELETPQGTLQGQTLGQGPPLFFLNGLEGSSELFRLLAWLLKDEFRCVLFDPVSLSSSTAQTIGEVSSLPEVRQLFAIAELHGDDRILVYGSGFGGWVALAAMISEPNRFHGAVLQGAYAERQFKWLERCLLFLGKRSGRLLKDVPGWKSVFEQNHRRWFPPFDAPRWELFQYLAGQVRATDVVHRAGLLQEVKLNNRLSEISVPVLSLKSEGQGQMRLDSQQEMETAIPSCRADFLKDTGLVPHWTHPHRVAKLIRQFAATLPELEPSVPASVRR